MQTEKSRLRRALMRLQDEMRHLSIREQVNHLNQMFRGHYAYYGVAGIFGHCCGCIGPWNTTGAKC
jgi:RNA-directed DNA polymerase